MASDVPPHPNPTPAPVPVQVVPAAASNQEITIVSHCGLFYWWPVWAVGYLMALMTLFTGHRMAAVPPETRAYADYEIPTKGGDGKTERRDVLIVPAKEKLPSRTDANGVREPEKPYLHIATNSSYGVVFASVLLLVIFITNVPLRGLWSVVIIVFIVMLIVILALADIWSSILNAVYLLDIRINMGGYLFISTVLFILWLVTVIFFDRQIYMVFTPGQLKVCQEVGGGETAYDTQGMVVQKQRDDLFRHWILGLGSGDLIVRTAGANSHEFHLPNVLFIGRKLQMIEEMQRDRPVVKG